MALFPTSELVAKAWILGIPGIPSGKAASTLPTNRATFPEGFVTAVALPGSPQRHVKKREAILDVMCWFPPKEGSNKPPWYKAAQLAEIVFNAGYEEVLTVQRTLTDMPAEYNYARVLAWMPGEPEKRGQDSSGNAAFGMNVEMHWIEVPR